MTVLANFILHISDLILLHIIKVQGNQAGKQHAQTALIKQKRDDVFTSF